MPHKHKSIPIPASYSQEMNTICKARTVFRAFSYLLFLFFMLLGTCVHSSLWPIRVFTNSIRIPYVGLVVKSSLKCLSPELSHVLYLFLKASQLQSVVSLCGRFCFDAKLCLKIITFYWLLLWKITTTSYAFNNPLLTWIWTCNMNLFYRFSCRQCEVTNSTTDRRENCVKNISTIKAQFK